MPRMLLVLEAALAACAIAFGLASAGHADPLDLLAEEVLTPTVQIGDMAGARYCSGTLVHSDRDEASGEVLTLVLTAKHCTDAVRDRLMVHVPTYADNRVTVWTSYTATVASMYAAHDVAVLRLDDDDTLFGRVATLAPEGTVLREAEAVLVAGYPRALNRTVTDGRFQGVEGLELQPNKWMDFYRSSPAIVGGNSGGGLYHLNAAGHYELIGVVSMVWTGMWHLGYHVPVADARKALESVLRIEAARIASASAGDGRPG